MTQEKNISPVPHSVAAPLLLMSRPTLSDEEMRMAEELCRKIEDWKLFTEIAYAKFCMPWIHDHLSRMSPDTAPEGIVEFLQSASTRLIFSSLKVNAVQASFHKTCIQPLGVNHVYLKGPSLAARYHPKPTLRFSRDIDLLVSDADYEAVVRKALSEGYTLWADPDIDPFVPSEAEIRATLKYNDVTSVCSKEDVIVEIHREVDKHSGLFTSPELLANVERIQLGDIEVNVLPTDVLLSYVSYHNTRHIWSRLHWLADLDAMIKDPSFDRQKALDFAEQHSLAATVEACLDFCALSARPDEWDSLPDTDHGKQMLDLCLSNLGGTLELEYTLRSQYGQLGLPFEWMVTPSMRRGIISRHIATRLKPNYAQFAAWPLPAGLQWLYYLTRPLSGLKRRLFGKAE